jgi:hypothetical protein
MTDTAPTSELVRLRARVAELESELAGAEPAPRRHRTGAARATASTVLIVLACVLAPFSAVAVWASTQVSETDQYVETVAPLVDDPAVQRWIATETTDAILERLDVEGLTDDLLATIADRPRVPPRVADALPALAAPITEGVDGFVEGRVEQVVASSTFATVWTQANRAAHEQLVRLLEGEPGGAVTAQEGEVTLNLAPIIEEVKQRLVDQGFGLAANLPTIDRSVVLVQSDGVTRAQNLYRVLNSLGTWLPILVLLLLASGIYLARDHRRAVVNSALGVVGGMLAVGVLLAVGRVLYLDALPPGTLPDDAASSIFDTLVRFLRTSIRAIAVLALVVALGAALMGPSAAARRIRGGVASLGRRTGETGCGASPVAAWLGRHKRAVELGTVALGALFLTFWARPTALTVLVVAGIVLVLVFLVELLAVEPAAVDSVPVAATPVDGTGGGTAATPADTPADIPVQVPDDPAPLTEGPRQT